MTQAFFSDGVTEAIKILSHQFNLFSSFLLFGENPFDKVLHFYQPGSFVWWVPLKPRHHVLTRQRYTWCIIVVTTRNFNINECIVPVTSTFSLPFFRLDIFSLSLFLKDKISDSMSSPRQKRISWILQMEFDWSKTLRTRKGARLKNSSKNNSVPFLVNWTVFETKPQIKMLIKVLTMIRIW